MLKTVTPDTDTRILLTIKGQYGEAVIDVVVWVTGTNYHTKTEDTDAHGDHYRLTRSLENISDVGYLTVQVVQAMGLGSQKLQGNFACIFMQIRIHFIHVCLDQFQLCFMICE